MEGNPCSRDDDFRMYVATFLPQIQYYSYVLIMTEERDAGNERYEYDLQNNLFYIINSSTL